jgi:hypothetical protein
MVKPIRDYHNSRPKQDAKPDKKHKKSSAKEPTGSASAKPATALATLTNTSTSVVTSEPSTVAESTSTPPPAILKLTILGINAITKALERSIQDLAAHPAPTAIILCKGDLIPSHLYAHLGPMIAMLPGVLLFPLLKGSERRLSEALGLPAVGALAIQSTEGSREAEDLVMMLKGMVEPMTASWLPKVTPRPVVKDKSPKQPSATKPTGAATIDAGAGTVSTAGAVSGNTTEAPKVVANQPEYIVTNIKTIKTTMPIVVKTPKPAKSDNSNTNNNNNNNKGKGQQQQQSQQQKQKQQQSQGQNLKQKQQQANQGKNKKPPVDNLDSDRGQAKKAKNN